MAEEFQRGKLYAYAANSNLVLQADKDSKRNRGDEGTGEVETLHGRLGGVRMGDRIKHDISKDSEVEKVKQKRQRTDLADEKNPKKRASVDSNLFESSILTSTADIDTINYRPKTRESRLAYEEMLGFVVAYLGDQPQDVLRGAADEILSILKDDSLKDHERQREVEKILARMSPEKFHKLVNMGKMIKDFNTGGSSAAQEDGMQQDDLMDEDQGVAVVFDDEEDDEEEGYGGFSGGFVDEVGAGDGDSNEEEEEGDEMGVEEGTDAGEVGAKSTLRGRGGEDGEDPDHEQLSALDIDAHWLQRQLSKFYSDANVSSKLAEETLDILQVSDERACENKLVVLLDFDKFDFIKLLLKNRAKVYFCSKLKQAQSDEERAAVESLMREDSVGAVILDQLHAKSSAASWTQDRIGEFARKARREATTLTDDGAREGATGSASGSRIVDDNLEDGTAGYTHAQDTGRGGDSAGAGTGAGGRLAEKNVDLDSLKFGQGARLMSNQRCELPEKSWRATKKGYEEVHVPAVKPIIPPGERLVEVAELPEWMQPAFPGIRALNRIQSKMKQTALYEADNILLCAPTGAGKTNVALMAMLNTIAQHRNEDGTIDLDAFKIVYIAPMKALVQECVQSFGKKLAPFGVTVRELSGDQNLSRSQIVETQVIITTPEKWDIITRKAGDRTYTQLVKLMIIDEIHLLHDDRGPVLEALVARTFRQIEATQELVRMVGLSATLPNFEDVATFLRVNPERGLFFFDNSFRPVPLQQQYIGVTEKKALKRFQLMNEICYEKALQHAGRNQILIFVHSRAETVKTAKALRDMALENDSLSQFVRDDSASKEILREESEQTAKNPDLKDLIKDGFAVHHAGLTRSDRTLVEDLFGDKHVQVLVSTATLAWGVNLPAHSVIIKGTQMYSPEEGRWIELSPLDIMQMMGRAGRYGLDSEGEGIIITQHSELQYYLSLMNQQLPIESQFIKKLPDMLNAEVVIGSVQTVQEAAQWLGYTYLHVRMMQNPHLYGISSGDDDAVLLQRRRDLVHSAAMILDKHNLIKYDRKTGSFHTTVMGRVASHYYVSHDSIHVFNEYLKPSMSDIEIFRLFSLSGEFKQIHVREEEKLELGKLVPRVPIPIKEGVDEPSAKVNVLLQAYISRLKLDGFALVADMTYVQQSACRLMRALFEVALKKGWANLAAKTLHICKMVERRTWGSQSPLRQFNAIPEIIVRKLEKNSDILWDRYFDLKPQDLGEMVKIPKMGKTLHKYVHMFPKLLLEAQVLPITRSLLKISLTITPDFQFDTNVHDFAQLFWVVVEDGDGERVLHSEPFILKAQHSAVDHLVDFVVPLFEPLPPQYFIKVTSDRWLHSEVVTTVSFRHLILPAKYPPCTELLDLQPLPVGVLRRKGVDPAFEKLFSDPASGIAPILHFNPIQTQSFNALFESDDNVLVCAPTGSGKTICGEFAMLRLFASSETAKCVYLAPKNDVAGAMLKHWTHRFGAMLGKKVVRLTGESAVDLKLIEAGQLIIASAVHWDMVSRRWKQRKHIRDISLYVADELHLVGGNDGPALEVVLSRARFIASQCEKSVRIVGLSSSLANAKDMGEWLGVSQNCVYNFSPSIRPRPLELHFHGFETNHLGNRMLAMAKPAYDAVNNRCVVTTGNGSTYCKPAVVFVPSRKQCQLTAIDFITSAASTGGGSKFLNLSNKEDMSRIVCDGGEGSAAHSLVVRDKALRDALHHGVGFLHAGLGKADVEAVMHLFRDEIIGVLVVSFGLCWQLPPACAFLVVVMDTVYYEGREHRYTDYPITDIMHMVGLASFTSANTSPAVRACRLPADVSVNTAASTGVSVSSCVAILMCHAPKKAYLKRLLHDPLPIESHLNHYLHDHLNAEIATRTVENKQDAVDYLTWTYLYRRLVQNPNYYNMDGVTHRHLSDYLSELVEATVSELAESKCVQVEEDDIDLSPLNLGMVSSYYYLQYTTVELFAASVTDKSKVKGLVEVLSAASEFASITMRQGEDAQLQRLAKHLPMALGADAKYDAVATKVNVLLQCYFSRFPLPADLVHDLNTLVLRDSCKLVQAVVDVLSTEGWLKPALAAMELSQMVVQGMWDKDPVLLQLPHFTSEVLERLAIFAKKKRQEPVITVFDLLEMEDDDRESCLQMTQAQLSDVADFCNNYPNIEVNFSVNNGPPRGSNQEDEEETEGTQVRASSVVFIIHVIAVPYVYISVVYVYISAVYVYISVVYVYISVVYVYISVVLG